MRQFIVLGRVRKKNKMRGYRVNIYDVNVCIQWIIVFRDFLFFIMFNILLVSIINLGVNVLINEFMGNILFCI